METRNPTSDKREESVEESDLQRYVFPEQVEIGRRALNSWRGSDGDGNI